MLYVEVTAFSQFCDAFPKSRQEAYSYEGLQALYEYWDSRSDELSEDIEISEELDYPCCEYDSAVQAVEDRGYYGEVIYDCVDDYLRDNDIELDDDEEWEDYIDKVDEDDIEAKCLEWLENDRKIEYVEELDNGHVFIVRYD